LPSGVKVTNPVQTWGGDEAETVAEAEQRIPRTLQHRDRLVAHADFGDIIAQTPGVEIGRTDILPLVHPDMDDSDAPGVVTLVVIPAYDPLHPNAPQPDALFLDTICTYLEPRRLITTELHVIGPNYVPIWLSVGIQVIPGTATATVREAVKTALRTFLSPLAGGFAGTGWPLGKTVAQLELWAKAASVSGVAQVTGVLLAGQSGSAATEIPLDRLQLPNLIAVEVQIGPPTPLSALRGDVLVAVDGGRTVPVPVIEMEC
jgi:predicted phage baseplate assembly protein